MAASSSTAAQSINNQVYDVFINHRGPDVKDTFARSLYLQLLSNGLTAFLDKHEMQPGYNFSCQIEHAIRTASVHVAIFSPRYAESKWCLNELLLMLESKAPIIPVFYRVKPSEVRWTQGKDGTYAQALKQLAKKKKKTYDPQNHKKKLRYDSCTIENWRNALSSVADNSGFELETRNGDELELELLDKLVDCLLKMVKREALHVAKYPTGLDEKLRDFEDTVLSQQQQGGKSQIFGIVGLGGVGKTTLAKQFFNRRNSDYQKSCFLSDIRDSAAKGSLNLLQRTLLKTLSRSDKAIDTVDQGKGMLIEPLKSFNFLLILDDVDDVNQVDALLPVRNHDLRLILITSRDKHVLRSSRVEKSSIYTLTGLNTQHSRKLFCSYAFSQPDPNPGFESLVDKFLDSCNGLPLSLKVFGAHLYGGDIAEWEDELKSLRQILPSEIKETLKISYNALNKEEKQIFLDIASFFIGQNRDTAIRIWEGSGWNGRRGFQTLQNKSLVDLDSSNGIHMHDHLIDMGRDIAEDLNLPCRLWQWTQNTIDNLLQRSSGITVRGLRMVLSDFHAEDVYSIICMRRLQLLDIEDALLETVLRMVEFPNLLWLRWNKCPSSSLPSSIPMNNLRVLQVSGSQLTTLWQDESLAPLQLRELEIVAPLCNIPKSIGQLKYLERIVVDGISPSELLDIQMTKLPEEFCHLQSLKALVLRFCAEIVSLPNSFGDLSNLEHIELVGCSKLARLPKSFGKLTKLKYLDMDGSCNVTLRSEALGKISTLQYIDLFNCEKIEILPPQVVHQGSLVTLKLRGTNLKRLPSAIGELRYLEVLELGSPLLNSLPTSLGDLRNLKELTIWDCKKLKCLPPSLGNLCNLRILNIWDCDELKCLPPSFGDLRNLKELFISSCQELKCFPAFVGELTQLTKLAVFRCPFSKLPSEKVIEGERGALPTSSHLDSSVVKCMPRLREFLLETTKILEVPVCHNLEILHITWCHDLVNVETLPNTLIDLEIIFCSNLRKIKGLSGLAKLERLIISGCQKVATLPSMETFVSLKKLWIFNCPKQKKIQGLVHLKKLISLKVSDCQQLEKLEGVEHCLSLRELEILDCPKLQWGEGILEQVRQQMEGCKIGSPEGIYDELTSGIYDQLSSEPDWIRQMKLASLDKKVRRRIHQQLSGLSNYI